MGKRLPVNVAKNGQVVVVAAGDKFEVLGRVPLGELSYATPAVAGGVMYLRPDPICFRSGAGANSLFPNCRHGSDPIRLARMVNEIGGYGIRSCRTTDLIQLAWMVNQT